MPSVLVIDRDERHLQRLRSYFVNLGIDMVHARRCSDGLEQAIKMKPSLILMEANMPDATGFQMCKRFKANEATKSIPIVMMSGMAVFANQQRFALERGAKAYISKPVKVVELGELVDTYVSPASSQPAQPPGYKLTLATDTNIMLNKWLKAVQPQDTDPSSGNSLEPIQ